MIPELERKAKISYNYALKKAMVDYILLDDAEKLRLRIYNVPKPHPHFFLRGPYPWHSSITVSKEIIRNTLFLVHPILVRMRALWNDKYKSL